MSQEKRTLLAVLLSLGILIAYSVWFAPAPTPEAPPPSAPQAVPETPSMPAEPRSAQAVPAEGSDSFPKAPEVQLRR